MQIAQNFSTGQGHFVYIVHNKFVKVFTKSLKVCAYCTIAHNVLAIANKLLAYANRVEQVFDC